MKYALFALAEGVAGNVVLVSDDPHESYCGIPVAVGDAVDILQAVGRHTAGQATTDVIPQTACRRALCEAVGEPD